MNNLFHFLKNHVKTCMKEIDNKDEKIENILIEMQKKEEIFELFFNDICPKYDLDCNTVKKR